MSEPLHAALAPDSAGARKRTGMPRNDRLRRGILAFAGLAILLAASRDGAAAQALPDAASIVRKYIEAIGGAAFGDKPGMVTQGTFSMPAMGTSGAMQVSQARPNRLVLSMNLPGIGEMRSGFDGETGWSLNPLEGPRLLTGTELMQLKDDADFGATLREARLITGMETVDRREVEGQACFRVRIQWKSGRETFDCYATDTGLLVSTEMRTETVMGTVDAAVFFSNYKEFDGIRMPTRTIQRVMGQEFVMTLDAVRFGPVDEAVFALPAEIKALIKD